MCNSWCLDFIRNSLSLIPEGAGAVLEVGSRDVNGSARSILTHYLFDEIEHTEPEYVGVDLEAGPGVDLVGDVADLYRMSLPCPFFDVVVSTEMLEHVADWREAVWQMGLRVKGDGLMILTTRSPGFEYHPYPLDRWRFTVEHMQAIYSAPHWEILQIDTDPDPGQHGPAPFGYYGVGVIARLSPFAYRTLPAWYERLALVRPFSP